MDLTNWVVRTSRKFTTGVMFQNTVPPLHFRQYQIIIEYFVKTQSSPNLHKYDQCTYYMKIRRCDRAIVQKNCISNITRCGRRVTSLPLTKGVRIRSSFESVFLVMVFTGFFLNRKTNVGKT